MAGFNLADLFELVADAVPDRTAIVAGDTSRTYAELDERATRLAHELGVEPGSHVGLCLRNSIAHVELMLACYKARAVPVNVNWRYTEAELQYVADDADLVQLWRDADLEPLAFEARIARGGPQRDFHGRSGDDHYVLYTGGTTGRPKGVVWRQEDIFFAALGGGNPGGPAITDPAAIVRSVIDNPAQRLRAFLPPDDPGPPQFVALALGPLVHASGQWSALGTLLGGGKLVLYTDAHVDMERVLTLVAGERVSSLNLVGDASARPLLDALRSAPDRFDTSSLLLLGSGGSMLSADVKHQLLEELPSVLGIVEGVGSSESPAQAVAVTTRATAAPAASLTFSAKAETIVVDDDLRPIPNGSGAVGRLATRGRVPLAYYKDPERSARTFVEIDGAALVVARRHGDHRRRRNRAPARPRIPVHQHRWREGVSRRGRGRAQDRGGGARCRRDRRPRRAIRPARRRDRRAHRPPHRRRHSTRSKRTVARYLAGYKIPRAMHTVDAVRRNEAGKVDLAWARAVVDG